MYSVVMNKFFITLYISGFLLMKEVPSNEALKMAPQEKRLCETKSETQTKRTYRTYF